MNIAIPDNVLHAMAILEQNGHSAYAVGGCVRDSLLGHKPYDWDICTSALTEQMEECFADFRIIPTGVKHGTLTIIVDEPLEITTFRIDGDYLDNRRPSGVLFTRNLSDDLCRRDFTVNAMALNSRGEITDLYGGREDLEAKRIRCVGDAETRFDEDALRIMRALRFASTLGFEIEEKTASAIHAKKHLLKNIAAERIQKEFTKLLTGNCCEILAEFSDVISVFLPEIQTNTDTLRRLAASSADSALRLAILFGNASAQTAADRLHALKYDNRTINQICLMLDSAPAEIRTERPQIKRLLNRYGEEDAKTVLAFHLYSEKITDETHRAATTAVDDIIASGECFTLSKLAVNGRDISALGLFPAKQTGKVLFTLLERVMDEEAKNEKDSLLLLAKSLKY
ncbi:MAG: CCA tRNA nucleotidyltransferase [Clostridia bacterium]|nr:CCA tRNA nucleotidyltransferase [Clostridia bacterium]